MVNQYLETYVPQEAHATAQQMFQSQVRDTMSKKVELEGFWAQRQLNMDRWMKTIRLDNYLEARDMESFISNEPKNTFNLALGILSEASIPHVTLKDPDLGDAQLAVLTQVDRVITRYWRHINRWNTVRGRKSWLREQMGYMLATGWYSVYLDVDDEKVTAENWNPYTVFPWYDDDYGLLEVVRVTTMKMETVISKITRLNWPSDLRASNVTKEIEVTDHFKMDPYTGIVWNGVVGGNKVIKPWTPHMNLDRIPIEVGPVGGFSDRGEMQSTRDRWAGNYGESIVAANYWVQRNFNRQLSYLQQMMRDSANPKFWEKSQGENIIQPSDVFKRGAIFRMGINEDVGTMAPSGIPIELSTSLRDVQDMIAKAGFANTFFGVSNNTQSAVQTRAIIESNQQVMGPFIEGLQTLITGVDEFWVNQAVKNSVRPYGIKFNGSSIRNFVEFNIRIFPKIPGDFANRAQIAKQLNPNWLMSEEAINLQLFPELGDGMRHQARLRAEMALRNPVLADLNAIMALEAEADAMEAAGDNESAALWFSVADKMRETLGVRIEGENPAIQGVAQQLLPQEEVL